MIIFIHSKFTDCKKCIMLNEISCNNLGVLKGVVAKNERWLTMKNKRF